VDSGSGEEVPHLSSETVRLRATGHRRISRIAPRRRTPSGTRGYRTKRPNLEWRVPADVQNREITVPECPI